MISVIRMVFILVSDSVSCTDPSFMALSSDETIVRFYLLFPAKHQKDARNERDLLLDLLILFGLFIFVEKARCKSMRFRVAFRKTPALQCMRLAQLHR